MAERRGSPAAAPTEYRLWMKAAVRPYETRDFPAALALLQRSGGAVATIERLMPLLDGRGRGRRRGRERWRARRHRGRRAAGGTGGRGDSIAPEADRPGLLASVRSEERRVSPSVTNEFLKQIPRMREAPHHLLACATNWVSRLDPAFLRPGRFDYVLPVGPPDADARRMVWQRYIGEITDEPVDVDEIVAASDLFTPADIEWAARTAAQRAFEREHFGGVARARDDGRLPGLDQECQSDPDAGDRRGVRGRDGAVQARLSS